MFCIKCGTELPEDALFCYKCGNKVTIFSQSFDESDETYDEGDEYEDDEDFEDDEDEDDDEEEEEEDLETTSDYLNRDDYNFDKTLPSEPKAFAINDYTIKFDTNVVRFNHFFVPIQRDALNNYEKANQFWEQNINQIDDVLSKGRKFLANSIDNTINIAVDLLQKAGIDCDYYAVRKEALPYFPLQFLDKFESLSDHVKYKGDLLRQKHDKSGYTPSRWTGGGFGVTGSIMGAAIAGILNVGSSALNEASKAVISASDNARISEMKEEAIQGDQYKDTYTRGVLNCCLAVMKSVEYILLRTGAISEMNFDISELSEKFRTIRPEEEIKRYFNILRDILERNPFETEFYLKWYKYDPEHKYQLSMMADYFGIGKVLDNAIKDYVDFLLKKAYNMPDVRLEDMEEKIREIDSIKNRFSAHIDIDYYRELRSKLNDKAKSEFNAALNFSEGRIIDLEEKIETLETLHQKYNLPIDMDYIEELKNKYAEKSGKSYSKTVKIDPSEVVPEPTSNYPDCVKNEIESIHNYAEGRIIDLEEKIEALTDLYMKYNIRPEEDYLNELYNKLEEKKKNRDALK